MAKTQDLKRRIRSVKNTQQLTRAMKMVSAAKLRRAQDRILAARPYAHRLQSVLRSAAARANPELNPLLQIHGRRKVELLIVTGDKGLCGSFNAGILRTSENFIAEELQGRDVTVTAIGKKGVEYLRRRNYSIRNRHVDIFRDVQFSIAEEIGSELIERYVAEDLDEIYLCFNEFKSAIQARPVVQRLLPIEKMETGEGETAEDYLYEPDADRLFAALLPHYVKQQVFQALLESVAAEHAARMTAMDSATKNASELIESLTLTMNRVRQAAITTEIIEVVSGAEALG